MTTKIRLTSMPEDTNFAPLGVLGYCLTRADFLLPVFADLALPVKEVVYTPAMKLTDVVCSILAGCRAIYQINTRLCPDVALARAWGRERFAEQSTVARTLDAFTDAQVTQLRQGSEALFRHESRTLRHNFAQDWLWLDIDLTPLPISKYAEGSTKGKLGAKNTYGRQLARVHAPQYKETLFSRLYPGAQHSSPTYIPAIQALDQYLGLGQAQKERTFLRSDAGFGGDANVNYVLDQHWQVLTKGSGGRRPGALAHQITPEAWHPLRPNERWVAPAVAPPAYVRPVQYLVLRWLTEAGKLKHSTVICSALDWPITQVVEYYDDRGACETEIEADKGGLKLCQRRKRSLAAQETLVLLTDVAHNTLAWVSDWMFPDGPLAAFDTTRLVEDVLAIPGHLIFNGEQLVEAHLNELHPYASHVAAGLERLMEHFGNP